MPQPKILVGCPTSFHQEYALLQYSQALKALTYPNMDILLVDNSQDDVYMQKIKAHGLEVIKGPWFESARDRIIASRNILRDKVLSEGYDYFLSLEQDVLPPKDFIQSLLTHKKQITTGLYLNFFGSQGKTTLIPVVWSHIKDGNLHTIKPEQFNTGLIKVIGCGLGCVLIHRSVLSQIKFRYDKAHEGFDDVHFLRDCKKHNFEIYADTNLICKHLIRNRPYPWSKILK